MDRKIDQINDGNLAEDVILERGFRRFGELNYALAKEAFTDVIEKTSCNEILLKAFDCRAACYEKLLDLSRALQDSKAMIRINPRSSKGYLRAGKILYLQNQKDVALKIYKRGLDKVKVDADQERLILHSMYYKLKIELKQTKMHDPFQYLPTELLQMIFQRLEFQHLSTCLAVSKSWKCKLESFRNLWTTLDLSGIRKPIPIRSLQAFLKRSNYNLQRAFIHLNYFIGERRLRYLFESSPYLSELHLCEFGEIDENLLRFLPMAKNIEKIYTSKEVIITGDNVLKALNICHLTLVKVSILGISNYRCRHFYDTWPRLDALRSIILKTCPISSPNKMKIEMNKLIQAAPNVTTVRLVGFDCQPNTKLDLTAWSRLEELRLEHTQTVRLPKLPPTIRVLALDYNRTEIYRNHENDGLVLIPLLEKLSLKSNYLAPRDLFDLTRCCINANNLKSLIISRWIFPSSCPPLYEYFPPSASLEDLSISDIPLDDKCAVEILKMYPNLKIIDLSHTLISGVTIKALVEKGGITLIRIEACFNVSPDAVDFATHNNIKVIYRNLS
ncbi:F-box/TPR repeat containing protein pof3 [Golovinomyces cichoracearum]|uniref:F-box/TPR repeat containing protein pof3 n=1 Tax=Golovinomyces cichoracearum TaxID=62708 RepID=A0A420IQU8_9PEZI|nr:F-box/TPR repeat containing protein pof3 [Golovinomyces cichoracearum]